MMTRWWGIGVGLLALAGCEVSVGKCSQRDDAGQCVFEDDFPDFDGGLGADASSPDAAGSDGGDFADGAIADAGAGSDGGMVDSGALNPTQFCEGQYAAALKWRALLEDPACGCNSAEDVRYFLGAVFIFSDSTITDCLNLVDRVVAGGGSFVPTQAAACAARFASQFPATPASCPSAGIDIGTIEATVGHGVQLVQQLPECRAALVGSKAQGQPCTNALECASGLRCYATMGAGLACRPARSLNESCTPRLGDCADGFVCSANVVSGSGEVSSTCIPANDLKGPGGRCSISAECDSGYLCDGNRHECVSSAPELICGAS